MIFYDFRPAKDNDALYIESPLSFAAVAAVIDAVRNLIASLDRVRSVSFFSGVKIQFSVLFVIPVI